MGMDSSVVHRQPFHADPDLNPTFHFGADPDPVPIPSFARAGKSFFFYIYSQHCQSTLFYLSRLRHRCHAFQ